MMENSEKLSKLICKLFVNLMLNSSEVEVLSSEMRRYMAGRNLPYLRIFFM